MIVHKNADTLKRTEYNSFIDFALIVVCHISTHDVVAKMTFGAGVFHAKI
jgi:hypothetical protein